MPADTFTEMVMGFGVIVGILLIYVLSLILRTRKAKIKHEKITKE